MMMRILSRPFPEMSSIETIAAKAITPVAETIVWSKAKAVMRTWRPLRTSFASTKRWVFRRSLPKVPTIKTRTIEAIA